MVDQVLFFFERFGYHAIAWFWIPMFLWTLCLAVVYPFLRLFPRLHPNYQYHARLALLYSLPIGLLLFLIPFQEFIQQGDAPLLEAAMVKTLYFNTDTMVAARQTPGSWFQVICTLTGAVSISIFVGGMLRIYRLVCSFSDLRVLAKHKTDPQYASIARQMEAISQSLNIHRTPTLLVTDRIHIPLTFGFIRPVIVIPKHLVDDRTSLSPILLHELVHVMRADYLLTWFEQILLSVGNINPLLKILCSEIEDYREQSCDALVLTNSGIPKNLYASILFRISQYRDPSYLVDLRLARNNSSHLRRRITAIKHISLQRLYSNHRFVMSKIFSLALLVVVSGMLAGAYHMNFNEDFNPATRAKKYETYDVMPTFLGFSGTSDAAYNYPSIAMLAGTQGTVILDLRIDATGRVNRIGITQDPGSGLGNFARKQVEKAMFTPAIEDGKPVASNVAFPVTFDLSKGKANVYYGITPSIANRVPTSIPNSSIATKTTPNLNPERTTAPTAIQKGEVEPEPEVFLVVEEDPQLIGGLSALQRKIKYPEIALKAQIEGRVFIQFVVDERGNVVNPRVTRGIGGGCDEAALAAIQDAKFTPGRQRGRPVKVQYSLPITFRLQQR